MFVDVLSINKVKLIFLLICDGETKEKVKKIIKIYPFEGWSRKMNLFIFMDILVKEKIIIFCFFFVYC